VTLSAQKEDSTMAIDRDQYDLKKWKVVFKLANKLWNDVNYDDLGELFDVDIIMKKLDDPGSVVGIGNALTYLKKNQVVRRPQFNVTRQFSPYKSPLLVQVSGEGKYLDKTGEAEIPVLFTFTFKREKEDKEWLLVNAFQAYKMD
jgi:hypothetical protein